LRILNFTPESQRWRDNGVDSAWPGHDLPEWTADISQSYRCM
jgi:hypothetical protein